MTASTGGDKASPLKLTVHQAGSIPVEQQLVTQLRLAVMLGVLQPGQKLPSIRDVEKQTGVGRFVVWKAYSKLAESGLVTLEGRRRAVVNDREKHEGASERLKVSAWLARDLLQRTKALGLNPSAFIRFFEQASKGTPQFERDLVFLECNSVLARRWSAEISDLWGVHVLGMDFDEVRAMPPEEREEVRVVLTPVMHEEEARSVFQHPGTQIIALRQSWNEGTLNALRDLDRGRIALVLDKSEVGTYGESFAKEIRARCPRLHVDIVSFRDAAHTRKLLASDRYARVYLSGPVQEKIGETADTDRLLAHLIELDRGSLEEARISSGVII